MHTLANSEDLDEIPHNAAIHQGLCRLQSQKRSSKKEIQFYLEAITCYPWICSVDHPKSILQSDEV